LTGPNFARKSFTVLLSDVSILINGLGSSLSVMFYGLAKEERDGICSAYGTLPVDLADGVCNISHQRDGDNRAVATSFPPDLTQGIPSMMMPGKLRSTSYSFPLPP
jgi:hypothetical protein